MSATMIHENKYLQDSIEDDELSTSVGSSDNEMSPTSGDDEPPSPSAKAHDLGVATMTPNANDLGMNTVLAAQVFLVVGALLEMYPLLPSALLSVALLGINAKPQQPKSPSTTASNTRDGAGTPSARPQPQARKVAKSSAAQRQPVGPPPGLSLPRREAKGQRFVNQAVAPPPGLNLERGEAEDQCPSVEEIGPPPGLSLHLPEVGSQRAAPVKAMRLPPGLESFSPPPGIFFPHGQKDVKLAPARRTRGRKQASATVGPAQLVSAECPKPPRAKSPPPPPVAPREFDQAVYRKELSAVLRELATRNNVAVAVQRIRAQNVPRQRQAQEFCDILTRAAEENRGVVRRLSFAFATGLGAGEPSAFAREECLAGVQLFFEDVFEDLASEVPRLRNKLANELVPTLRTVLCGEELLKILPHDCRPVQC